MKIKIIAFFRIHHYGAIKNLKARPSHEFVVKEYYGGRQQESYSKISWDQGVECVTNLITQRLVLILKDLMVAYIQSLDITN